MSSSNEYNNPEFGPENNSPNGNENNGNNGNGNNGNNENNGNGSKKPNPMTALVFVLFTLVALFVMSFFVESTTSAKNKEKTYTEFLTELEDGNIKSVEYDNYQINYTLVKDKKAKKGQEITYYTGYIEDPELIQSMKTMVTKDGDKIEVKRKVPDTTSAIILEAVGWILPLVLMWILLSFLMKKMSGGAMGVGKSTAKV